MPRVSQQEVVTASVQPYLAMGETLAAEEYPLNIRSVARSLHISPTTLYKYHLDEMIAAAREHQRKNAHGKAPEKRTYLDRLRSLEAELEQER